MKRILFTCLGLIICSFAFSQKPGSYDGNSQYLPYEIDNIPAVISDTIWNVDMRGNHRAVVMVDKCEKGGAVSAFLPWRRPDLRADKKRVVVVDVQTNLEIKNVEVRDFSNESATVVFEATSGNGLYHIYFMPFKFRQGWDDARYGKPWDDYLPATYETNKEWVNKYAGHATQGKVLKFESRSRFDAFTPMGIIASKKEMDGIKNKYPNGAIVFSEDRAFPIRLTYQIPYRWKNKVPFETFKGVAQKDEYYTWQIGVWAAHKELRDVRLAFSDFKCGSNVIRAKEFTCFNQEGTNWDGKPLNFDINIPHNKVQALWCGVQIPKDAKAGTYKGQVTVNSSNEPSKTIPVQIRVKGPVIADKGDSETWRHSRLRWLNSTIGMDNDVVKPYKGMTVMENKIIATDKVLSLDYNGLPAAISINEKEILASPMRFVVVTDKGDMVFNAEKIKIRREAEGLVTWTASSETQGIRIENKGSMEFDGYAHFDLKVSSDRNINIKDIRLETYYSQYASTYFMGVGSFGGFCPKEYKWQWKKGPWDSYWMGNAKAGLHVEFLGGSYHGPLINDYKPEPPVSWCNDSKGSVQVTKSGNEATVIVSSGNGIIPKDGKSYEFDIKITPAKPINTSKHFSERYFHSSPKDFDKAAEDGANVCNIHHARDLNPVINYPFVVQEPLKAFINHEHEFNRKVKLYYTIRELTTSATEIHALKSLNNEIFDAGVGYGAPWLHEHLIDGYRPAWYSELPNQFADAALALSGFSRWINYYLEGLRWMFENYKIDGIYMDDVSFDRPVMKRMRKIIEKYRPEAIIDLHSNTNYAILSANQYTGFFPYVDRLWFGESFQYNSMTPEQWLITFSGIPFGPMSEMLQDGGNRFLGMVYGATARHSYGQWSPTPVWKLWKDFGIENAKMLGYWDEECPVSTSDNEVKATAYVKADKVLLSIGNFSKENKNIKLTINWEKLKMNSQNKILTAPEIEQFQHSRQFKLNETIPVKAKGGWLLILENKN